MDNLVFSEPIQIKVRDPRNAVMLDYNHSLHFYYLTSIIDKETGDRVKVEDEGQRREVLHAARIDYKVDEKRKYEEIESIDPPEEETYLIKEPKTEENPDPSFLDIYSFTVKNFLVSPTQLTKAYAFINVRNEEQPIFRYGEGLDKELMAIQAGELS